MYVIKWCSEDPHYFVKADNRLESTWSAGPVNAKHYETEKDAQAEISKSLADLKNVSIIEHIT